MEAPVDDPRKTVSEPPKSPQAMDVDEMPTGLPANGTLIQTTKNEVKEEEECPARPSEPPAEPTMPDAGLPGEGNGAMSAEIQAPQDAH